jgi:hypothetical protein
MGSKDWGDRECSLAGPVLGGSVGARESGCVAQAGGSWRPPLGGELAMTRVGGRDPEDSPLPGDPR